MQKEQVKKLWLLRVYVRLLEAITKYILLLYIVGCIYLWILNKNNFWGDLLLGAGGIYIVLISIGVLITAQIIRLFLNIHDDISDIRMKTINPEFQLATDNEQETKQTHYKSMGTVIILGIAILFLIINFIKAADHTTDSNNEIKNIQKNNLKKDTYQPNDERTLKSENPFNQ